MDDKYLINHCYDSAGPSNQCSCNTSRIQEGAHNIESAFEVILASWDFWIFLYRCRTKHDRDVEESPFKPLSSDYEFCFGYSEMWIVSPIAAKLHYGSQQQDVANSAVIPGEPRITRCQHQACLLGAAHCSTLCILSGIPSLRPISSVYHL